MSKKRKTPSPTSIFFDQNPVSEAISKTAESLLKYEKIIRARAIVYCEDSFGDVEGKIANDLVRYSDTYEIVSVIDGEKAGRDSGDVLKGEPNKIPIFRNLGSALAQAGRAPAYFIFGMTPEGGTLSDAERRLLLRAIGYKMNIATEHHEVLNNDPEFVEACAKTNVVINEVASGL